MSKNNVIKFLLCLAAIGAVIGALIVFLKKREVEDDDIFEDEDDEEIISCPGCQDKDRNYTTISRETEEEVVAEESAE